MHACIHEKVFGEIQQSGRSNREKVEVLLNAVEESVTRNSSEFEIVLKILSGLPPPEKEGVYE